MFKKPTSRRKSEKEQIELNLVPILDTMVTLISFLLFTMSFLAIVSIESPFPQASAQSVQQKLKEKPLQLTVTLRKKEIEIWSPFNRIQSKKIPHTAEDLPDTVALHSALLEIKQQFPNETQVVIVPPSTANYDTLISVMDAMRVIEKTDPPIYTKNDETGADEIVKTLFPNVVFGNLLGDA